MGTHSIGTARMGSCMQCMDTRKVWETEQCTEHSLQYVCTVVRSAQTCERLQQYVWLEKEPVVCRRVQRHGNTHM
jgi:hypothetical protein